MTGRDFVVFYAWQSDSPSSDNRNFIESALNSAIKNMHRTGSIQASPRLDKDTKDVPGIPDIANTILEKIKASDVFVADVTFIGRTNSESQRDEEPIPNPNVMIELGYALSELGWERIICVFNNTSGSTDKLPFDLRNRRWPIAYTISDETDKTSRKQEGEKLAKHVQDAVENIVKLPPRDKRSTTDQRLDAIENTVIKLSESIVRNTGNQFVSLHEISSDSTENKDMKVECQKKLDALANRVMEGKFENLKLQQGIQAISILPFSVSPPLPLFDHGNTDKLKLRPLYASGWSSYIRGDRIVTYSEFDKVIDAVTEITTEGIINAAGYRISAVSSQFLNNIAPEGVLVIPSVAFEKDIIEAVFSYLKALRTLGATGPWFIGIALLNVNKSLLYVGARYAFGGRIFEGERINSPVVEISTNTEIDDHQVVARALRPAFDHVWREHNYPYSLNYGENGDWVGH